MSIQIKHDNSGYYYRTETMDEWMPVIAKNKIEFYEKLMEKLKLNFEIDFE